MATDRKSLNIPVTAIAGWNWWPLIGPWVCRGRREAWLHKAQTCHLASIISNYAQGNHSVFKNRLCTYVLWQDRALAIPSHSDTFCWLQGAVSPRNIFPQWVWHHKFTQMYDVTHPWPPQEMSLSGVPGSTWWAPWPYEVIYNLNSSTSEICIKGLGGMPEGGGGTSKTAWTSAGWGA